MAPSQRLLQAMNKGPEFEKHFYSVNILKSVPPMSPVVRVTANESGLEGNTLITYRLLNQSGNEFDISNHTGQIYGVSVPDEVGIYTLRVQASDSAGRSDQSTVQIRVDPEDSFSSSHNGLVVLKLNQTRKITEQQLPNIISIIGGILHSNIWIRLVSSSAEGGGMRGEITTIWFQAVDKNNHVAREEDVLKNLTDNIRNIQQHLDKLFGSPVEFSLSKTLTFSLRYGAELGGAIGALGALLAVWLAGVSIYMIIRNKWNNFVEDKPVPPGAEKEPQNLDNGTKSPSEEAPTSPTAEEPGKESVSVTLQGDDKGDKPVETESPSEEAPTSPTAEEPGKESVSVTLQGDDKGDKPVETDTGKEGEAGGEAAASGTEVDKMKEETVPEKDPETVPADATKKDDSDEVGENISTTATFLD
ncbi:uncharacterized protein LOC121393626 isoform X2 [Xenopus laevis]|nr:uncharacterized protein LOC121393626 isoform X2 [Xenopus laevis]